MMAKDKDLIKTSGYFVFLSFCKTFFWKFLNL